MSSFAMSHRWVPYLLHATAEFTRCSYVLSCVIRGAQVGEVIKVDTSNNKYVGRVKE